MPLKHRWILLLAASYYFYMCWKVEYIGLIVLSTIVDYFRGNRNFLKTKAELARKVLLSLSLFVNLGIFVFCFKYFNFVNDAIRSVFQRFNVFYDVPYFDVLLPVGISFYTFQTISYTVDVYLKKVSPERHLGRFALYVSFFSPIGSWTY